MAFSRNNALDQILDIQGSFSQSSTRVLSDELGGLGATLLNQTGATASIAAAIGGVSTVTGLSGMSAASVGNFLTLSGAANNGTFLIIGFTSGSSVDISNGTATAESNVPWAERRPYCLNDDLDFERTDRAAIKGVGYAAAIPTYSLAATGELVPADLAHIAGKTTDARGFIFSRKFAGAPVADGNTNVILTSAGNLEHSGADDKTGVPCFDADPYVGKYTECYVQILNPADGTEFHVISNGEGHAGWKIFGLTQGGTSPDSVQVAFRSVPPSGDLALSEAYVWEGAAGPSGQGVATIDLIYGFYEQLDQVSETALRTMQSLGVEESTSLRSDVNDLQSVIGVLDGDQWLKGLLNKTASFPFATLDTAPSVTEALNLLNDAIGDRVYATLPLGSGETVTESLNALATKIDDLSGDLASSGVVRYIERLDTPVAANDPHPLSFTYVPSADGAGLSVYTRGILRDPGSVIDGNDYAEDPGGASVTFYSALKIGDHINYYVYS